MSEQRCKWCGDSTHESHPPHVYCEATWHRAVEAAERIVGGMDCEIERAERHRDSRGKGGQHVPCHGDFIGVNVSSMQRLKWWMRELRKALLPPEEIDDD